MNGRGVDGDHLYGVDPSGPSAGRSAVSPHRPPTVGVETDHARLQADVDLICAYLEVEP